MKINSHIGRTQSMYSIIDMEVSHFFEAEGLDGPESPAIIANIIDLFFKTIGIKQYTDVDQLMIDIRDHIKIPIITAKEYSKTQNFTNDRLILKAVDAMQTKIKKYVSSAPVFAP